MVLGGRIAVLQVPAFDVFPFDTFPFDQDGLAAYKVDGGRGQIVQALMVAAVIVALEEGLDLGVEAPG